MKRNESSIKITGISTAIGNREIRNRAIFRVVGTAHIYIFEGKEYTPADFDAQFPTDFKIPISPKGSNVDRRKAWLTNEKSY